MSKILIIGVGNSQIQALGKMAKAIPNAKCISISSGYHPDNMPSKVELYNPLWYSPTAQHILSLGLMPGVAGPMIIDNYEQILLEQEDILRELIN